MGTQTMGSQGAVGGGGSGGTLDPKSHALTRQGSLYNLTLDEVQHQLGNLGKPLSSMNLDEVLKSVGGNDGFTPGPFSLSREVRKKTVDEIWQDIQQDQNRNNHNRRVHERQCTLGEMTLEDFLVKAGVVSESYSMVLAPPQAQWMPYQQNQHSNMMAVYMPGQQIQQAIPIGGNQDVEPVYAESQMSVSPSALMGALSNNQTPGRKRLATGDVVEKTVERRHKRMIKNRESAARSRARKQAYTHELENKVSRLEEENERLKRMKEVEKLLPSPSPEPRYQLRRTSSAPVR